MPAAQPSALCRILPLTLLLAGLGGLCAPTPGSRDAFVEGKAAYGAGDFNRALALLRKAFRDTPDDLEVSFHLGLAAMAAGDYEAAAMAFDRVLVMAPEAHRARLELAACYFRLGLYTIADDHLKAVLQEDLPENVRANAIALSRAIGDRQRRHFFSGSLTLSGTYDTNARVSPADAVTLPGFLNSIDIPTEEDWLVSQTLALRHQYRPGAGGLRWLTDLVSYDAVYAEQTDLDLNFLGCSSGPDLTFGDTTVALRLNGSRMNQDYTNYLRVFGGAISAARPVTARLAVSTRGVVESRKYYRTPENTSVHFLWSVDPTLTWADNRIELSCSYQADNARSDAESYDAVAAGVRYLRAFPDLRLTAFVRCAWSLTQYDRPGAFSLSRRVDNEHQIAVGWRKTIATSLTVEVSHRYVRTDSNIGLYDSKRNISALAVTYAF